jgi:CubicO group peptidase (beta-lactamase class C family)
MNRGSEIEAALQKVVDEGQLAGVATLVWRDGVALTVCAGSRDIEANLPVERDTIFRIASMTKPITSVAALMLVEEGRIALADPLLAMPPSFQTCAYCILPAGPSMKRNRRNA